jgi:translation elongation factor EF-Ts
MKISDKSIQLHFAWALHFHTGIGLMDCLKALEEAKGDFNEALKILRCKFSPSDWIKE